MVEEQPQAWPWDLTHWALLEPLASVRYPWILPINKPFALSSFSRFPYLQTSHNQGKWLTVRANILVIEFMEMPFKVIFSLIQQMPNEGLLNTATMTVLGRHCKTYRRHLLIYEDDNQASC